MHPSWKLKMAFKQKKERNKYLSWPLLSCFSASFLNLYHNYIGKPWLLHLDWDDLLQTGCWYGSFHPSWAYNTSHFTTTFLLVSSPKFVASNFNWVVWKFKYCVICVAYTYHIEESYAHNISGCGLSPIGAFL